MDMNKIYKAISFFFIGMMIVGVATAVVVNIDGSNLVPVSWWSTNKTVWDAKGNASYPLNVSNATGVLPNASIPASAANISSSNTFNAKQFFKGAIYADFNMYLENDAANGVSGFSILDNTSTQKGFWGWDNSFGFFRWNGLATLTGDAMCMGGNQRVTVNTGSSTCAVSAEKYKSIKGAFNDSTVQNKFPQLNPIVFIYKDDEKQLDKFGFSANEIAIQYPQIVYTHYQGNGTFAKLILNSTNSNKADAVQYSDGTIADIEGINYEMFSAILVNQVREQQKQIDSLDARVQKLEDKLNLKKP